MTLQTYFSASLSHKFPSDSHHAELHCHEQSSLLLLSPSPRFKAVSMKPPHTPVPAAFLPHQQSHISHSSFQLPGCCLSGFCLKVHKKEMIDLCWPRYRLLRDSFPKDVCLCVRNIHKDMGHRHGSDTGLTWGRYILSEILMVCLLFYFLTQHTQAF